LATSSGNVRGVHDRRGPAFDLPVQAGAAPDFYAQAAVIAVAGILADRRGAVPLQSRAPELRGIGSGDTQPEPLGGIDIGALMDLDPVNQPVRLDACGPEEAQEQADKRSVAVREDTLSLRRYGLFLAPSHQ
jgi:hypothetical protein